MPDGARKFYRRVKRDLAEAGPQIGVAVLLFIAASFLGAFSPGLGAKALEAFKDFVQDLMGMGVGELALAIFLRNSMAAAIAIVGGTLFGLLPVAALLFNGILFGTVIRLFPGEAWKVIPHGIFELPAMFIAWGLGLWIGMSLLDRPRLRHLKERLGASTRIFLGLLIPLLALAAAIEAVAAALYRS